MRARFTAAVSTAALCITLTACDIGIGKSDAGDEPVGPPVYTVVEKEESGDERDIVVEVDSTDNLRGVFDDVVNGLVDEAGYVIRVNCSSSTWENRLATGRYAAGEIGVAITGLDKGQREFKPVDGAKCPDE